MTMSQIMEDLKIEDNHLNSVSVNCDVDTPLRDLFARPIKYELELNGSHYTMQYETVK
jgi:hypothetical protein